MLTFEEIAESREKPINIIHGTDWWTDCDDICALRLLCRAHNAGAINLKCVCADAVMEDTAASLSAFLDNDGLGNIPIGLDSHFSGINTRCKYQKVFAEYSHKVENKDCEEAYKLYRRVLAGLDGKADITEIGFPQIIHHLLISKPDEISPLSGMELVRQKVNHIWMMAGKWDEDGGREYNFSAYPEAMEAGSFICENSPVPITFLGFEVGETVITGGNLPEDDLVTVGFSAHGSPKGRCSWDPMLVLMAIINNEETAGYKSVHGTATVEKGTGRNHFSEGEGIHTYVVKNLPDNEYSQWINELIK